MRRLSLLLLTVCFAAVVNAQVTVTNPGNTTPGLAASYPTLAAAITDLNLQTAISGPVTITLAAGNPQTSPSGGYAITSILTGASATNTVTIDGSGNTITAPSPAGTAGNLNDAIFKFIGSDFMILQNFVMNENGANTTTTAASNNMVEWGVALLYASTTNGAQNITIQNNTITLNRTYQNTFGIYSNSTHSATTVTTSATATTTAGGNSGLKVYGNTISNVNLGIVVVGPTAAADANTGIDIGGSGGGQANTITNFGTTGTFSGYANVSGTVNGILVRNSIGFNISYNTITSSAGGTTAGTLNGIQIPAASAAPTTAFTNNINNNTISLQSAVAAGSINGITYPSGSASTTSVVNINANNFTQLNHSVAASGTIIAITIASTNLTTSISNNTFTNLSANTTGNFTFISHSFSMPAGGSQTVNNNSIVTAFNKTGAGGTVTCTTTGASSPNGTTSSVTNNNFSNITVTGATTIQGTLNNDGAGSSATKIFTGNTYSNWTGGTSSITCVTYNYVGATTSSISNNTFSNITGQGAITAISIGSTFNGATTLNVASNTITNITSTGTGGSVTGIACTNTSTTININGNTISTLASSGASSIVAGITIGGATTTNVFQNTINTLSGSGATSPLINGISVTAGTAVNVYRNKLYDFSESGAITTTSPAINGIVASGGTTVTIYNNLVGDLRTPAAGLTDAIRGISVTSTTASTTYNVYYNSVYIAATSTGTNFGTTGIFHAASATSTTATLNLRNNIIVNNSTPAGTGVVTCYRRSVAATLGNYGTASNNNDFFSTTGSVMHDGTTAFNIATFKVAVAPRESASFSEDPEFQSTVGSSSDFLKYKTSSPKQIESGAANITTYTNDYAGTIRQGNAGYTGTGTSPDVGGWELEGIGLDLAGPTITYTALANTLCTTAPSLSATITDASSVNTTAGTNPRLWYRKATNANALPGTNDNTTDGWKYVEASNGTSPFSFTIDYNLLFGGAPVAGDVIHYFVVAQDLAGTPNVGINTGTFTAPPATVALGAGSFPVTGNNTYSILTGISPTGVTVGTGGTYNTLTEAGAGGLFAAINAGGLTANTTVTIISNTTETGAVALNQIVYGCSGPYTLTIVPLAATSPVVSGSVAGPMINLNGADNVIFDGSNNGTSTKDMTFSNTNTGGSVFQFINDATGNTVKNAIILGVNSSSTSGSIVFSTSTGTLGNSSNTINNNDIRDGATVPVNAIYSSGSGGALNASNTISGNNIFNWTGSGVLVTSTGAGNSWNINNNNVYQTAARTSTLIAISLAGGNTHTVSNNKLYQTAGTLSAAYTGISITGSTNGHTISSNSIGGSTATRSGTALEVTAGSSNLTAISLAVGTTTATNVNSNSISNLAITTSSTSSSLFGVNITAGNVNIGTGGGNTFGGGAAAYDTLRNAYDNGIITNSGSGVVDIQNNTIGNLAYYRAGGDRTAGINISAGTATIRNNIIRDFNVLGTGTGFSFLPVGIVLSTATSGNLVEGNQVYNIRQTNTGTAAYTAAGIIVSGAVTTTSVSKNKVYNILADGTGTGTNSPRVFGIYSSAGSATYSNNMVGVGGTVGLESRITGIEDAGTGTNNYYFNSVSVTGTTAAGANNSYAFNRSGTATVDIKNNIFSNTRTGGTGFHVAIANTNAAATGWAASASNYNDLYTTTPSTLGQWLGTALANNRDFTGWKAAQGAGTPGSGGDANSFNVVPGFVSATDLHIPAGTTGPLESGGTPAGSITTDIDGDTRPGPAGSTNGGATQVDIGADEFDGIPASNMTYVSSTTTQTNTSNVSTNTTNQQVIGIQIVTTGALNPLNVTDFTLNTNGTTNVADIANAKLWYTGTSSTFATTTQVGTTVAAPNGSFQFTPTQQLAEGTNYFWLTYDVPCSATASNVIDAECNSLTVGSAQTPTVQAPAGSRTIVVGPLSGSYTVGSGGNYTTLTDAIADVNTKGLAANTTLNILNNLAEAGMITISQWVECGAGNYTLTIKPAAATTPTISTSSVNAVLKLDGADRVIIDGSNNGTTSRDMTISNTNTGTSSAVIWVASATASNGANNNIIRNCNLTGNATTTTLMGIFQGGTASVSTTTSALTNNASNTYQNNQITLVQYGVFARGVDATTLGTGLQVIQNTIGTAANGFGFTGVTVQYQTAALIESNEIQNQVQASTTNSGGVIILDNQNSTISKNNIHNLNYTGSSTGKMVGIHTSSATYNVVGTPSNLLISNNIIYDLKSTATSTSWNTSGISNGGGYGDRYYYNTVYLTGSLSGSGGTGGSACFANGNGLTSTNADALDMRNNVFAMTGTSVAAAPLYAHYTTRTTLTGFTLNYNSLYVSVTGSATGHYGRFNATNYTTFANWQGVAGEANSIGVNPLLNSATNLNPGLGSPLLNAGTPVTVLDDITGFTRSVTTPTIGAYEQASDGSAPTITYTPLSLSCSTGDRLLAGVTIADPSTVPTTGTLQPRVYFRKNAGSWFSSQGTLMTGNGTSGTWDFTISAATMGGLANGDVIQYYVIAQDQAAVPNIGSNPAAGLVATDVNTVTTHPTSPNSTTVGATLNGTYTVGAGGNYTSLTAAVNAYNTGCLTGAVTFSLLDASYTSGETFPISIAANATSSATNTLTILPTQPSTVISGTGAGGLIIMNGADYVTIDGRIGGTGTTHSLTITNTNTTAAAIQFLNDASNNTVKYTDLKSDNTSTGVITFSGSTGTTGNDNNTIDNCNIGPNAATPVFGIYSLGASSTADNSGITISNNNIFDFFSAGSASAGINVNSFSSGWTITGNSFYQTATRTSTVSNQHSGIFLSNSGSGFTITGNFIGGSTANAGGAAWNLAGAFTNRFVGISVSVSSTATTEIQGNTIANITTNTTSSATTSNGNFSGIWVSGGNANIGTVTGNTIGSGTGTGSINLTLQTNSGGTANIIAYSGAGTVDIRNNTVGSINLLGATTSIGYGFNGIYVSGGTPTIINNSIGSAATANSINSSTVATGTQSLMGIQVTSAVTTGTTLTITGNTVANINQSGTSTASLLRGISYAGTVQANISSNIVHDLTGASANTTVAGGATAVIGICYTGTSPAGATISLNEVYAIRATNNGAVQTNPAGIGYSNPSNGVIFKNKIYDITNASTMTTATTPPTAIGLLLRAALGSGVTVSNNMISLGNGQSTNTEFLGIVNSFTTVATFIYHNTVNIEGTAAAGALPSFCFLRGDNSATSAITSTVDLRNNIFNNARTGGTGIHYAIGNNYGNTTSSATGWAANASNYNALNGSGGVGYWSTTQNFAGWKAASAGDGTSVSGFPVTFVNSAAGNLHLNMGVTPTPFESGGVTGTGITDDYDNQARPGPAGSTNGGATAPDMGADEFDGVPQDLFVPLITYTALTNTTCITDRTFTATATDNSGVNVTAGTKPRLYFKRSTDANAWNDNTNATDGWKYVEATNGSSPFSFTTNYALLNGGTGVAVGTTLQYFVVAQDLAITPNVAINNGTFAATPSSVALTGAAFPIGGTINSYAITTGLNTTLTVGAAGDYTSLTGATGLFNAINTNGLVGNTTVNILDASVTETGAIALNQIQDGGCSLNNYSLVIKPNTGVTATLTGALNNAALVRILSSNVTIDGSNSGGTTRNLTITNTSTTGPSVLLFGSTGTTPISGSMVKNSTIVNGTQSNSAVLITDATTPGNPGYFNNITVQNNSIQQAFIGVFANAAVVAGNGSGTLMTGNDLNTAGAASIRLVGLYAQGVDGVTITNNNIGNISNANAETPRGIWLATGTNAGTVSGNTISSLTSTNTGAFNVTGIYVSPGSTATAINVTNNTISTLSGAGTGTTLSGIYTTSPNTNVTNNTISAVSQASGGSSSVFASGILQSAASNSTISGNSISNISSAGSTTASGICIIGASTGVNIFRNQVSNIKNTSSSGWGSNGIQLASTSTTANINVYNNLIYDVASQGFDGADFLDNGYGITLTSGGGYNVRFNSVNMNTDQVVGGSRTAALNVETGVTTAASVDIRDNVFSNTQTLGNRYAIINSGAATVFSNINYNDYYSTGVVGYNGTTEYANLAAWQAFTTQDANSLAVNPQFTSATNLTPLATSPLIGAGVTIAGITSDYLSATRNGTPSIGAYEQRVVFSAKVFLQGAYNTGLGRHRDNTANWTTVTNAGALSQPYSGAPYNYAGTETVAAGFFASTGATTDPMDWVLVEVRDATTPTTVVTRKAAIIREDGLIVDLDGTSPVSFRGVNAGTYFVVVRHRNHLGVRSGTTQTIDGNAATPATYDFTTAQSQALQDVAITTNAAMAQDGSVFLLWGGNVNQDAYVRATTQTLPPPVKPSDVAAILTLLGGNANATGGYTPGDVNLDGYTRATTQTLPPPAKPSDAAIILSSPLGGNGNATRQEHKVNN